MVIDFPKQWGWSTSGWGRSHACLFPSLAVEIPLSYFFMLFYSGGFLFFPSKAVHGMAWHGMPPLSLAFCSRCNIWPPWWSVSIPAAPRVSVNLPSVVALLFLTCYSFSIYNCGLELTWWSLVWNGNLFFMVGSIVLSIAFHVSVILSRHFIFPRFFSIK